ncbi:MAG: regulator of G-protein signaling domain-containing protein [Cyanobacteria bacterium P01_E01_bin.42]
MQRDTIQREDDPPGTTSTTPAPTGLLGLLGTGGTAPNAPTLNDLGNTYPTKANLLNDKFKWESWKDVMVWATYRSFVPEIVRFIDAVEKYQSSPSYAEMVRIYRTYVEIGSEFEVNVAWNERESVRQRVEAQINGGQQPVDKIFNAASVIVYQLLQGGTLKAWQKFKEDIILKIMANMVRAGMMAEEDLTSDEWKRVETIEKNYASNKRDLDRHVAQAMQGASRWEKLTGKRKKAAIAAYYSG